MSKTNTMVANTLAEAAKVNQNFDELGQQADAQVTANQGTFTTEVDLTGLTVTLTISAAAAAAGRRLKISWRAKYSSSVASDRVTTNLKEGSTGLQSTVIALVGTSSETVSDFVTITPTSGSHTYKLTALRQTGTGNITMAASAGQPAELLVEMI